MNKNKILILLVLLIAVVGLTMGSVSAKSTTKKVVKVKTKYDSWNSKTSGKYRVNVYNGDRYEDSVGKVVDNILLVQVFKNNKPISGNKFLTKVYYTSKGKKKVSSWIKGSKKYPFHRGVLNKNIKVKEVKVKI